MGGTEIDVRDIVVFLAAVEIATFHQCDPATLGLALLVRREFVVVTRVVAGHRGCGDRREHR